LVTIKCPKRERGKYNNVQHKIFSQKKEMRNKNIARCKTVTFPVVVKYIHNIEFAGH
jgi:hypothetical protein